MSSHRTIQTELDSIKNSITAAVDLGDWDALPQLARSAKRIEGLATRFGFEADYEQALVGRQVIR